MKINRERWTEEEKDANMQYFGRAIVDLMATTHDHYADIRCDDKFASILGWEYVPIDDDNDPYQVIGIAELKNGTEVAVFNIMRNLSGGHDYTYASGYSLTPEESSRVKDWIKDRCSEADAAAEKKRRVEELFKANGVDDLSVHQRRKELLAAHNLK